MRGLESNQRPPDSESGVTTSSNCPAVFQKRCLEKTVFRKQCFHQGCVPFAKGSGRRIRTFIACFKGRWPTISRSPSVVCSTSQIDRRVPCGSWTRLSGLEDRCLCRSAKGTSCFHFVSSCGGRNRTCDKAVNSRPPVPTRAPPQLHCAFTFDSKKSRRGRI